MRTSTRADIII